MITLNGEIFYSPAEAREKLPFLMSERELRKLARRHGIGREWRRQLVLTEADLLKIVNKLDATCRSSSPSAKGPRRGTRGVQSTATAISRAQALLAAPTPKHG